MITSFFVVSLSATVRIDDRPAARMPSAKNFHAANCLLCHTGCGSIAETCKCHSFLLKEWTGR